MLIYKLVSVGSMTISAATFILPFWYFLGDTIAEVYGYEISRRLIWYALFCQFIFIMITSLMIKLPSPTYWHEQHAFNQIIGRLPRVFIGGSVAVLLGSFINIYVLAKSKIIMKGKYFWVRSIGATTLGEAIFTITAFLIEFLGTIPLSRIAELIIASYCLKLIIAPFAVIPSSFFARKLKKIERVDVYDYNTDFNPFKI